MTENVPFAAVADKKPTVDTQTAIDELAYGLNGQTLANRDDLALWLKKYVPLAYEAKDDDSIDPHCQLVSGKLKRGVGYQKGYHYMNTSDQIGLPAKEFVDLPAKAYADTALVNTADSLGNGRPVHPESVMACLDEYIARRREEDVLAFKGLEL